jgi:nucleoside-diphosphate-sugar epimerase
VESLAYAYHVEKGSEIRIVRFFNAVGPRQLGSFGMVLPRFVKAALTNQPLTIYGGGIQTRCFTHIYDVIDAVMLVAFSETTNGKVLNIGNPVETSIRELAERVIGKWNCDQCSKVENSVAAFHCILNPVWVSNITYENLKISLYIVITFIKPTPRIE